MTEEVGEISRILNVKYGDKKKKLNDKDNELDAELADLFLTIVFIANSQDINLESAYEKKIEKMNVRDINNYVKK